ncbi:hypothetical protein PAE9249_04304 [Paenibacillus sp. CECT 9249]|uniref:CAP domain-containing protein n=1 Tax=Paenibacillus sp. CECT 9249 TaxID=2845385 RepID=UPI001E3D2DA1|nr:CAP domain-containing protein [Paenibacillus sp. CECT 9249]CAH0121771.1 hypothetical protein PAE9249_04304 [Paenibacillus sp. CECT 9249]
MKKHLTKTVFAATLALGLIIPTAASAAPAGDCSSFLQDILNKLPRNTQVIQNPDFGKIAWPGFGNEQGKQGNQEQGNKDQGKQNQGNQNQGKQQNNQGNVPADAAAFASQVVDLVNQERAKEGLKPLAVDQQLAKMAMDKAIDMRTNGYFDHNSPTYGSPFDMMTQYGIDYRYAGENIARGQRTPQEVMNAWMNSPGHRQNIMSPNFTLIGVAYYQGDWVQEFISK